MNRISNVNRMKGGLVQPPPKIGDFLQGLKQKLEVMVGRTDEVAGDVGGDNRRPLEEVNRRHLEEEKPRLLQQQKLTAAGDGRSPAAGDSQVAAGDLFR
ncbi:hypothetical protein LWI29_006665 [Acer saccharum]|uniref:Uncharacterized protein n=1 Tax=Acer saccharum TaxID=4024 RepID=A0AA39RLN7_ACESA|nr:hypothetical protein LWI29_006665 [Acer saccharum]